MNTVNSKERLHLCLNLINDKKWHAGNLYIFNIVSAIDKLPADERARVKLSIATRNPADIPADVREKADTVYTETFFHLAWYKLLRMLPAFLRLRAFNFRKIDFYYPAGNLPKQWIFNWGGWIPDFQYRHLPHLFSKEEYDMREHRSIHLAKEARTLAFSSQHAIDDYVHFFPQYAGNEVLLHFVSNADQKWLQADPAETQQKFSLPDAFFIVCNQFWKHKDHGTVIEAMALLKQKGISITVACTGATEDFRDPAYFPSLLEKARAAGVEEQFRVLGFISRSDQMQLIRRAVAIIQPSLFEGWSTVVEDGRALGKTMFVSDFPVHLEQDPPHTFYFRQQDAAQLATLIGQHLSSLQPGPDKDSEAAAYIRNQQMMVAFGRRVVEIAEKSSDF